MSGAAAGYAAPAAGSRSRHAHTADLDGDIDQNREFYRRQDVRPPYTYAALIRQVGGMELVEFFFYMSDLLVLDPAFLQDRISVSFCRSGCKFMLFNGKFRRYQVQT